jgi:hypothetical protein
MFRNVHVESILRRNTAVTKRKESSHTVARIHAAYFNKFLEKTQQRQRRKKEGRKKER